MKKMAFSAALIFLLLAGLVAAMGVAGDEPEPPVEITVWLDGSYEVPQGEPVELRAGWASCNPGLVTAFTVASNWLMTLDGEQLLTTDDVDELWGPIQIFDPPPDFTEDCVGKGRPAWAEWRYVLSGLEVGTYELHTRVRLDHPVVDGADYDGDGRPDQQTPEGFIRDSEITITVIE
jgi:hypothetical protein